MKPPQKPVVRKMVECHSKQYGIYIGTRLIEGGFFSKQAAQAVANTYPSTP